MKVSLPGRTPDFVGFGVHRSGSTWLSAQLRRHPDLWTPPTVFKEVHYFDELHIPQHQAWHATRIPALIELLDRGLKKAKTEGDLRRIRRFAELATSDRDDDWYRAVFGMAHPDVKMVGEITPAYSLMGIDGLEHLRRLSPDVRIFIMFRDPAERVWSHLKLGMKREVKKNPKLLDDRDAMLARADAHGVVSRTEYRRMVESLEAVFPTEQIFVSFYDRVAEEPAALLEDFGRHLGVDPHGFDLATLDQRHHSSPAGRVPGWLVDWAADRFGDDVGWLADRFGPYPGRWMARQ